MPKLDTNALESKARGYLLWWNVSGDYERPTIDALCKRYKLKPLRKAPRSSFTNSLRQLQASDPTIVTKKLKDDITMIIYAIASVSKKIEARELEWGDQSWVAFDKTTNSVTWRQNDTRVEKFRKAFDEFEAKYTSADIRALIDRELDFAFPLRPSGGLYYSEPSKKAKLKSIADFLVATGGTNRLCSVAVNGDDHESMDSVKHGFDIHAISIVNSIIERCSKGLDFAKAKRAMTEIKRIEDECVILEQAMNYSSSQLKKMAAKARKAVNQAYSS